MSSSRNSLSVYLTVDVEIWCDGWSDIDTRFSNCFQQYIYGRTPEGCYGLPYQLELLNAHDLTATFFVEPLFTTRFGIEPLAEIIGLLQSSKQDVQLHLHTEWVDEARQALLDGSRIKRQFIKDFGLDDQIKLISLGADILMRAGAERPVAFRAGSFGFNVDTLKALEACQIPTDSSYNAAVLGPGSGVAPGEFLLGCEQIGSVLEVPMSVFRDGLGRMRHLQLTACSWPEFESYLWRAREAGQRSAVVLWHGSELLERSRHRKDPFVVSRLKRLCAFLDRHRNDFSVRTLGSQAPSPHPLRNDFLSMGTWPTAVRFFEQATRRVLAKAKV